MSTSTVESPTTSEYRSNIRFCEIAHPYWLSLYKMGICYSTTGQCSFDEAFIQAALWMIIKDEDRQYLILHEEEGFQIEESSHSIIQKCRQPGCQFVSRHSCSNADGQYLRNERRAHLASHQKSGQRSFRLLFLGVLVVLAILILAAYKGWS
jgi:hypothetical protein